MLSRIILALALSVIAALCVEHRIEARGDFHRSDFQARVPISPGPIERPDHYSTRPHGRKAGLA